MGNKGALERLSFEGLFDGLSDLFKYGSLLFYGNSAPYFLEWTQ